MDEFKKKDPQKKYTKKLKKQTDRLHENSGKEKQLHLKITNQKQPDDKIRTTVKFVREEKSLNYDTQGLLHKLANQRFRVVGDVPKLSDMQPKGSLGKAALQTAKAGSFVIKKTGSALLTAESAGIKFNDYLRQKDKDKQQKILSNEQFQIKFTRRPNDKGKYKTYINFTRGENNFKLQHKGIVHRIANQKYRLVGDVPLTSKWVDTKLNKWNPKTVTGKAAKGLIQSGKTVLNTTSSAALKTALAIDSGAVKLTEHGKFHAKRTIAEGVMKYKRESNDDANKAVLAVSQFAFDGMKGMRYHAKKKKQHRLHKARYRLQKYSARDLKLQMKPVLKLNKRNIKEKKALLKINKISYKQSLAKVGKYRLAGKNPAALKKVQSQKKTRFKAQKKQYKQEKKLLKTQRKKVKSKLKFSKKNLSNLRLSSLLSTPMPLALRPVKYGSGRIIASGYQKALYADESNDFMKAVDAVKRQGLDRMKRQLSPSKLLDKNQIKKSKLQKKQGKQKAKLVKREGKLKSKIELKKTPAAKKTKPKLTAGKLKNAVNNFVKNVYEKEVKWFFMHLFIPVLLILLLFIMLFSCTSATITQSGFILGTFVAQDIDLSQAEEYYTKLGFDMNGKIMNIAPSGVISKNYKDVLKSLGIDTKNMTDDPTNVYWGKSDRLNYDPVWDFDPWKLWSFLCAYNYELVTNKDKTQDVKYWKFNDKIKNQIKQLFVDEYQFECVYDNASHWEELYNYDFKGFHYTTSGGFKNYGYVIFKEMPDSLKQFGVGKTVYFNVENGEILNCNKGYSSTGWYFQDQRYTITDPSGNSSEPFYQYAPNDAFQTEYSGGYGRYHQFEYLLNGQKTVTWIWIPRHQYSSKLPDGSDFQNKFNVIAAPKDVVVELYKVPNTLYIGELAYYNAPIDLVKNDWRSYMTKVINGETKIWSMGGFIEKCFKSGEPDGMTTNTGLCSFYQKYEWKKECNLYYNVKRKKTFDQVIMNKLNTLSDKKERIAYYNVLLGSEKGVSLYGNHQTYGNPLSGDSFKEYIKLGNILNFYGYDMQGWNFNHCNIAANGGLHKGVDVYYPSGLPISAPFDCKIDQYDAKNHVVILRKNDVDYWYDDKRDTMIYITNITLKSGYSKGSVLKNGENFAVSSANRKCMQGGKTKPNETINSNLGYDYVHIAAYIDTDGYGWNFVDPMLLFT